MSGGLRIEDVEGEGRHEEGRVDPGDMESGEASEVAELVRGRRVPTSRQAEELTYENHGVEVVLPDLKASRAQLGCDRLVVRMRFVVEVGRNRRREILERSARPKLVSHPSSKAEPESVRC